MTVSCCAKVWFWANMWQNDFHRGLLHRCPHCHCRIVVHHPCYQTNRKIEHKFDCSRDIVARHLPTCRCCAHKICLNYKKDSNPFKRDLWIWIIFYKAISQTYKQVVEVAGMVHFCWELSSLWRNATWHPLSNDVVPYYQNHHKWKETMHFRHCHCTLWRFVRTWVSSVFKSGSPPYSLGHPYWQRRHPRKKCPTSVSSFKSDGIDWDWRPNTKNNNNNHLLLSARPIKTPTSRDTKKYLLRTIVSKVGPRERQRLGTAMTRPSCSITQRKRRGYLTPDRSACLQMGLLSVKR